MNLELPVDEQLTDQERITRLEKRYNHLLAQMNSIKLNLEFAVNKSQDIQDNLKLIHDKNELVKAILEKLMGAKEN